MGGGLDALPHSLFLRTRRGRGPRGPGASAAPQHGVHQGEPTQDRTQEGARCLPGAPLSWALAVAQRQP